jgi:hypothetical protein
MGGAIALVGKTKKINRKKKKKKERSGRKEGGSRGKGRGMEEGARFHTGLFLRENLGPARQVGTTL